MKKKIIIIIIFLLVIFFVMFKFTKSDSSILLKDSKHYKNLNFNNIESIIINKYTEGGLDSETINDKEEIKKIYNSLKNIKIGEETNMACEDNTTIYVLNFFDGTSDTITIECDWIIIGDKRYLIK